MTGLLEAATLGPCDPECEVLALHLLPANSPWDLVRSLGVAIEAAADLWMEEERGRRAGAARCQNAGVGCSWPNCECGGAP